MRAIPGALMLLPRELVVIFVTKVGEASFHRNSRRPAPDGAGAEALPRVRIGLTRPRPTREQRV